MSIIDQLKIEHERAQEDARIANACTEAERRTATVKRNNEWWEYHAKPIFQRDFAFDISTVDVSNTGLAVVVHTEEGLVIHATWGSSIPGYPKWTVQTLDSQISVGNRRDVARWAATGGTPLLVETRRQP